MGKRMRVAAVVAILILMVAAFAGPVRGAETTLNSTYCSSPLNGTWDGVRLTCTIPAGNSGQIPAGDKLRLILQDSVQQSVLVHGTLTVNGIFELQGGRLGIDSGGTLINQGTLAHMTPDNDSLPDFVNTGTLANNGQIKVYKNATLNNYQGFTNAGSLTIEGRLENAFASGLSGSFTNTDTGTLNLVNSSGVTAQGTFRSTLDTSNTNYGNITINDINSRMDMSALTNHGDILNKGSFRAAHLTNSSTGQLYNEVWADWTCDNASAPSLINEGVFTNRFILNLLDGCTFTNRSGGGFVNSGATYVGKILGTSSHKGNLVNQGTVNNYGSIILSDYSFSEIDNDNDAVITNDGPYSVLELGLNSKVYNTGLIEHRNGVIRPGTTGSGDLINYRWEHPWDEDPGVINKYCAGLIDPQLRFFGPPPVDLCVGTIVIRKDTVPDGPTDFSFSGDLGTFLLDDDADPTLPNERTFSGLKPGSYRVTEADAAGFSLTAISCSSTEAGDTTTWDLSTRTATIDLDAYETVTCTFVNTASCTPPAVTTHPANVLITYGENASFSVAGTNYTSVQWQVNSGSGWSNITGATSTTYNLTKPAVSLSGSQYRAVLTSDCNPPATSSAATLTVNKAQVTATAGDYSGTYDGITHSPSACAVTGAYTGDLSCTNSPASVGPDVGSGSIVPLLVLNGEKETNFSVTFRNGSWSITPAPVTATAGDYSGSYDGASHAPSACAVTGAYTGDLSCTNNPASVGPDVGSGTVTVGDVIGTNLSNFAITELDGSWSITPAPVTATAGDYSGTYDGVAHAPSACAVTGAYTGDLTCTNSPASVGPDVGSGSVVPLLVLNGETETNFTVTSQNKSWSITPAPVTAKAGDYSGTYDGASHAPSACAVTGAYTGDLSCTNSPASVGPDVGSGIVVPLLVLNGETETNFTVTSQNGSWSITQATLTVTADNQTAQYSDKTPPLTFQYAGFQGNDDEDDLTTNPICSTTRLLSAPASPPTFPIICSGGVDGNYTFSYVNGTFTVTKEDATVTFDDANPAALQVSAPGGQLDANRLTLVVRVKEKVPDLAAATAAAGDINHAGLKVELQPLAGGSSTSLVCMGEAAGTGYAGVKTFTCTNSQALAVDTYDVVASVEGNYFAGVAYDGFTVYDPSLGLATGGGWFYWPGTKEKTNFGFTMKYNKKATNVQGSLLVLRHHADGTISRLKSNALDGLALKDGKGCGIATFSGRATYMTWDPSANEGLGGYVNSGGNRFSVYAEDCNEPGTGVDRFWIRSVDTLVMDNPASTYAVPIGGGNIAVPHKAK